MECLNASLKAIKLSEVGRQVGVILETIVLSLLSIATIVGNILVIASVVSFRRLRSRNCFHLLASLASADIAIGFLVMPFAVVYNLLGCWPLGSFLCKLYQSSDIMCCTSSILHLCLISLDRYIAVTNPLHYKTLVRPRRIWSMVLAVWVISVALSFGPVFSGSFGLVVAERNATLPSEQSCLMEVNRVYAVVSALTSFVLPLLVMTMAYIRVHRIASAYTENVKQRKAAQGRSHYGQQLVQQQQAVESAAELIAKQKKEQRPQKKKQHQHRLSSTETKATKTLGLILGCFYASWIPFFIIYVACPFTADRCASLPGWVVPLVTWIGYANSGVNPIVYCSNQREFRLAYLRLLGCRKGSDLRYLRSDQRNTASACPRHLDNQSVSPNGQRVVAMVEAAYPLSLGDSQQQEASSPVHLYNDGEV